MVELNHSFDYILACSFHQRKSIIQRRNCRKDKFYFIKKHLSFLQNTNRSVPINAVYIVCNDNYHNIRLKEKLNSLLTNYSISHKLSFLVRPNRGGSYAAWQHVLQLTLKHTKATLAFLCEDDYIPSDNNFYKPFISKMTVKTGYVASGYLSADEEIVDSRQLVKTCGYDHAAISNGFISYAAVKAVYNKYNNIFDINVNGTRYSDYCNNQLTFLNLLLREGYVCETIHDICTIPFCNVNNVIYYGAKNQYEPIQPIL